MAWICALVGGTVKHTSRGKHKIPLCLLYMLHALLFSVINGYQIHYKGHSNLEIKTIFKGMQICSSTPL